MKFASIDIGTNTILLLIAEASSSSPYNLTNIINYYQMPRIGKGLSPGNPVSPERIELMRSTLQHYSTIIKESNCDKILINATNAFRIASNKSELSDIVYKIIGVAPTIIDGDREAYLSFLGAVSSRIATGKTGIVIDIGGGSTEITIGTKDEIVFSHSFDFGVVSLSEKYLTANLPDVSQINQLKTDISSKLAILPDVDADIVVAVAGTPTSLSAIKQNLATYSDDLIEGSKLDSHDFREIYELMSKKTSCELLQSYPELLTGREDLIFCGLLILDSIRRILNHEEIIVSSKGLRYGAVSDYLLKAENRDKDRNSKKDQE